MIYLDYAANTPVDSSVMDVFEETTRKYYGNPNGLYTIGKEANSVIEDAAETMLSILNAEGSEVIYTSGATEANNLAVKGVARSYRENGKHIISTVLEHSSVSGPLTYLQTLGYEIDLVDITEEGRVDLSHLRNLMREDTILVSVCYVEGEMGMEQPVQEISQIVEQYENCFFHVDATQAVGKVPVSCKGIDLFTFAPHKFYGLNGTGVLLKKDEIILEPLLHGGNSTSIYRSGTPVPAFAAAAVQALKLSVSELEERQNRVREINARIRKRMKEYPFVRINSPADASPFFLNVSIKGKKAKDVQNALDERGVYLSPKSACSTPGTPSRAVYAVTKDRKNAMHSFRISLSHLLEDEQVQEFLHIFDACYEHLTEEGKK